MDAGAESVQHIIIDTNSDAGLSPGGGTIGPRFAREKLYSRFMADRTGSLPRRLHAHLCILSTEHKRDEGAALQRKAENRRKLEQNGLFTFRDARLTSEPSPV